MRFLRAVAFLILFTTSPLLAQNTLRQYLSGIDKDNTVAWEFFCTAGRNSGTWTTIPVPSNWECQGFGTFAYGKDDTAQPVESGKYRHTFSVPAVWDGRRVFLVFEGSMTDTTVAINGQPAGPMHQGSFYRFKYDVTKLLKYGQPNLLEATVNKLSADESVNKAERNSDYWLFGGIFRPVYLEAQPQEFIERVAIDAKADGSFSIDVYPNGASSADRIEVQLCDLDGEGVAETLSAALKPGQASAQLRAKVANIRTWTSETPALYRADIRLKKGDTTLHSFRQRFGFRTIEVRESDGIYVNGTRVLLKGACRHSFWPDSGRTLSRALCEADIRLMKELNMNAVRMSHYPPDEVFLDLCDELGLYVLDELGGWQKPYSTPVGRRLIEQMIQRDVNHPSILFWDNGNEGGWNTENDGEFAKHDPQKRQVLHPWEAFGPINTKHYPKYPQLQELLAGKLIVMPTEILHGLFDGGIGAGMWDYWEAIRKSPVGGGMFFWALVDEGVKRPDKNGEIDVFGNRGPDGIVGPYREREGSFYTVKQLWSPIVLDAKVDEKFDGTVSVENRYHFTNSNRCSFTWQLRTFATPLDKTAVTVVAEGKVPAPAIAPGKTGRFKLDLPADWRKADALAIRVDGEGRELWTWVYPIPAAKSWPARIVRQDGPSPASFAETEDAFTLKANGTTLRLGKHTGEILSVQRRGKTFALKDGPRLVSGSANPPRLAARQDGKDAIIEATYQGDSDLKRVTWRMTPGGWVKLDWEYQVDEPQWFLGITFEHDEGAMQGLRWLGAGPYRVWKNRLDGVTLGVWENAYNETLTGEKGWLYPEFRGYFGNIRWARLATDAGPITFVMESDNLYLHLLSEQRSKDKKLGPMQAAAKFPQGELSLLHAIPPIGNKFHEVTTVGPQSQRNQLKDPQRGSVWLQFGE